METAMTKYKLANLGSHTTQRDQDRLTTEIMKITGVIKIVLNPGRREFSVDFTGREPNFHLLKGACSTAGFQLERKL
jgi:hypothetical protein